MNKIKKLLSIGTILLLIPSAVMAYQVINEPNYGASVLSVYQGGTGASSFTSGQCIVGNGTDAFTSQACGGGGGGSSIWSTSTDNQLYYYNPGRPLLLGGTATTTDVENSMQILGGLYVDEATTTGLTINGERFTDLTGTGLTNTSGALTVDGSAIPGLLTLAQGNIYVGDGSNNPEATSSLFVLGSNGYVGIATSVPAYELDVNGDVQAQNIYPSVNGTYELGISETKAWNNMHFKDETGQYFSMRDIAFEQRNVVDDLPYMKIETFQTVVGGVWTVGYRTAGADAGLDLVVNIARKVYRVGTTSLTVDASAYAGTDASPNDVSIIVLPNGGTPILAATSTAHSDINMEHIDVVTIKAGTLSDSSITTYGSTNYKTQAYESLAKIIGRTTFRNLPYISGMAITSAADDVTIGTGEAMWMIDQFSTDEAQVTVDTLFYVDSSGNYATSTAWEFDGNYSTGESISANKFFNVYLGIIPTNYNNTEFRMMALVQRGDILDSEYKDMEDCIADDDGARVTQPSDLVLAVGFTPVARVCVKQIATNALQAYPSGLYHDDVRIGAESVGAGGAITSAFVDNEFTIQDDGNPTALMAFQVSGVTPGNTRTLTVQDSNGTIAYTSQLSDYLSLTAWYATTTHALMNSLPALATVGTITTGVWQGTAIDFSTYTNATGGRSITLNADAIDADTELYTDIKSFGYASSTLATTTAFYSWQVPNDITITRVTGNCNNGTTTIQFEERSNTKVTGTDILSSRFLIGGDMATTGIANASIAADNYVTFNTGGIFSGIPTVCFAYIKYTIDD